MKISDIQVSLVDYMGSDLSVVNAARVSFHKESDWESTEVYDDGFTEYAARGILSSRDQKLIEYLAKHKHISPFNHAFITCRVKAPIFVARQLVKHKFMPWNEVSRRYVDEEPEFYFPDYWRKKADNVKQGSSDEEFTDGRSLTYMKESIVLANNAYNVALKAGCSPEQARMILPQNMMTEWVWSGSLGAYADMLRLRLDPHTQAESRYVAEKIKNLIGPLFPVSLAALLEV